MSLSDLLKSGVTPPPSAQNDRRPGVPSRLGRRKRLQFPADLHPTANAALHRQGIEALYTHQPLPWTQIQTGRHPVIVTGHGQRQNALLQTCPCCTISRLTVQAPRPVPVSNQSFSPRPGPSISNHPSPLMPITNSHRCLQDGDNRLRGSARPAGPRPGAAHSQQPGYAAYGHFTTPPPAGQIFWPPAEVCGAGTKCTFTGHIWLARG